MFSRSLQRIGFPGLFLQGEVMGAMGLGFSADITTLAMGAM